MRNVFSTLNFYHKPWLVLCLLPYLVLSVAAAAHNHGLSLSVTPGQEVRLAAHPCAEHIDASAAPQSAESLGHAAKNHNSDSTHSANEVCLACQWSANASMMAATPVALSIPTTSESRVINASRAVPCTFAVATPNRGPPSL